MSDKFVKLKRLSDIRRENPGIKIGFRGGFATFEVSPGHEICVFAQKFGDRCLVVPDDYSVIEEGVLKRLPFIFTED